MSYTRYYLDISYAKWGVLTDAPKCERYRGEITFHQLLYTELATGEGEIGRAHV